MNTTTPPTMPQTTTQEQRLENAIKMTNYAMSFGNAHTALHLLMTSYAAIADHNQELTLKAGEASLQLGGVLIDTANSRKKSTH